MNSETIDALNGLTSDYLVLYQKSLAFHWMVEGPAFLTLHELFEKAYEECAKAADAIAERVRALRGRPVLTLKEVLADSAIEEDEGTTDADEMVRRLEADFAETLKAVGAAAAIADQAEDRATANLLDDLALRHEKLGWMLRAYLGQVEAPVETQRP